MMPAPHTLSTTTSTLNNINTGTGTGTGSIPGNNISSSNVHVGGNSGIGIGIGTGGIGGSGSKFKNVRLPVNAAVVTGDLLVEQCKIIESANLPIMLVFQNNEALLDNIRILFKSGDDLRQDCLVLQLIELMNSIWITEGLDLQMTPYRCVSTSLKQGMIEIVPNAVTTADIHRKAAGARGAFLGDSITHWLRNHNPTGSFPFFLLLFPSSFYSSFSLLLLPPSHFTASSFYCFPLLLLAPSSFYSFLPFTPSPFYPSPFTPFPFYFLPPTISLLKSFVFSSSQQSKCEILTIRKNNKLYIE